MNRKIYRMLVILLCAGILYRMIPAGGASESDNSVSDMLSVQNLPENPGAERDSGLEDSFRPESLRVLAETDEILELPSVLPQRFDSREQGRIPTVKSQGSYGTCWALAASSALEASLHPGERTQFSADHMALNNRFATSLSDGGDYVMVMAYLSGWQGPVLEEEDPYGDAYSPDGLSPAVHVQEIRLLEGCTREEIKEAVCRYGAVQTSLYMSRSETAPEKNYYNPVNAAWYYPQEKTQNHDVIILGWDDGYSRFHFSQVPPEDGAFICQNSWGRNFGKDGIFYVSYADGNIAKTGLAYSRIEAADNYDFLYQTDECGWVGQQGYAGETCWFANVYTAGEENGAEVSAESEAAREDERAEKESGTAGKNHEQTERGSDLAGKNAGLTEAALAQSQDLELAAFGFYATGPNTVCELYVAHDFENPGSFSGMKFLQRNELDQAGYYTVDLDAPEKIRPGEKFAMVVKITTPGGKHPVAVEYQADSYSRNVTTAGKEGYLSQDGVYWENTEQKFGSNVCLKGYFLRL